MKKIERESLEALHTHTHTHTHTSNLNNRIINKAIAINCFVNDTQKDSNILITEMVIG